MNASPFLRNLIIAAAASLIVITLSCGTSTPKTPAVGSIGADKVFRVYELRIEPGVSTATAFLRRENADGEPLELGSGASLTLNGKPMTREQRVYADTVAYADMNLAAADKFVFVLSDGKGNTFTDEIDVRTIEAAIEPPDASGAIRLKLSRPVGADESAEASVSIVAKNNAASKDGAGNIKVVDALNETRDAITISKADLDKLGSGSAVIRVSLTSEKKLSSGGGKAKIRITSPPIDVKVGDTDK